MRVRTSGRIQSIGASLYHQEVDTASSLGTWRLPRANLWSFLLSPVRGDFSLISVSRRGWLFDMHLEPAGDERTVYHCHPFIDGWVGAWGSVIVLVE